MEENRFEKQVQQKMDELKIQPSEDVWQHVQRRIEKKKDNKKTIFFFFLLVGFIFGVYFLWNAGQNSISQNNYITKRTADSVLMKKNTIQKNNHKNILPSANKNSDSIKNVIVYRNQIDKKKDIIKTKINREKIIQSYKPLQDVRVSSNIISKEPESTFFLRKKIQKNYAGNITAQINNSIVDQVPLSDSNVSAMNYDSANSFDTVTLLKNTPVASDLKKKDTSQKFTSIVKAQKIVNKNKWKPGILFSPGISSANTTFAGFNNASSSFSVPTANNPGTISARYNLKTTSSFGFIVGAFAEKNISAKKKFNIGINYKSFAIANKVIGSPPQGYSNKNLSKFNFVEIPLSLKIQFNNSKKIPLFWQAGLVLSELVSKKVQVNSTGNLGFSTALSISLFAQQKIPILIGPYFYDDASKIATEGLYNKKHFSLIGLRTEIIFGK